MATNDHKLATDVVLKAFEDVVQYVPGEEDEDQIGPRRVAFFNMFLNALPDHLLLWTQSVEIPEGVSASVLAPGVRLKLDLPGTVATLASEFDQSKNKVSPRLQEIVDVINSRDNRDLYAKLFGVIPHRVVKEEDLEVEDDDDDLVTKVDVLLADADSLPERVEIRLAGERQMRWLIKHSDGVITYVPVDHPHVKHLERLHEAGVPLTLAKSV